MVLFIPDTSWNLGPMQMLNKYLLSKLERDTNAESVLPLQGLILSIQVVTKLISGESQSNLISGENNLKR